MTHILVKWIGEERWNVYPVRALVDPNVGLHLLTEANAMDDLKGTVHGVYWKQGEEPSPAELLYFGKEPALERRRTKLARKAMQQLDSEMSAEPSARKSTSAAENVPCGECSDEFQRILRENEELKKQLRTAQDTVGAGKMVQKLRKVLETLQPSNCPDSEKVNIGGGVLVERTTLERLWKVCSGSPAKYARALLRVVFSLGQVPLWTAQQCAQEHGS